MRVQFGNRIVLPMTTDSDPRLGVAALTGPLASLIGGALLVVGFFAEQSSPDELAGGPGFPFYVFGGLALTFGVCWSLVASVVALAMLVRRRDGGARAAKTLRANMAPLLGVALFTLAVWLTNTS
jgi:hypothetical protein